MFDSHLHTTFSTDSKMNIEEAIKRAEELNLGLVITEHMDMKYPNKEKYVFNQEEYFKQYSKYLGPKLLLGIELGMRTDCIEENKKLIEKYPFDYVIGSVHLVDNIDIYRESFYEGKTKEEAYIQYLKYMYACVKTHSFIDTLGHIDYIARYAAYNDREIYYDHFADYIDEVLKTIISNNIALEINTKRFNNKDVILNLKKIYKSYYELGGRIVTVGSDSHNVKDIGNNFDLAKHIIEDSNLKLVYFRERKPEYVK